MPRFTVFRLLLAIVASAGVFAALRASNDYWAGGVQLVTMALIGVAVVRSIQGRAGWLGFLVFCGGYFVAVRVLPLQEVLSLPTTIAIGQAQPWLQSPDSSSRIIYNPIRSSPTPSNAPTVSSTLVVPNSLTNVVWDSTLQAPWAILFDAKTNSESFFKIAQNLFALLFGWLGACFAWRSQARRAADQAGSTQGS